MNLSFANYMTKISSFELDCKQRSDKFTSFALFGLITNNKLWKSLLFSVL